MPTAVMPTFREEALSVCQECAHGVKSAQVIDEVRVRALVSQGCAVLGAEVAFLDITVAEGTRLIIELSEQGFRVVHSVRPGACDSSNETCPSKHFETLDSLLFQHSETYQTSFHTLLTQKLAQLQNL